jgi:hypothetical protein
MARKKAPETVTFEGFTWIKENPASDPDRERWRVNVPTISVFVTDYKRDPRGENFRGWRVVAGAPGSEEYADREEAMAGARTTIESEVRNRILYTQHVIDSTNKAMAVLRAGGIPIGSKTR